MTSFKKKSKPSAFTYGLLYHPLFINRNQRAEVINWLQTIHPLWEMRFSKNNPPPDGDVQRRLLRPVYWLKNWQFACLNYYHPPDGIKHRCLHAEDYEPFLKKIVSSIEARTRSAFRQEDIPKGWHLNTCLINFYGKEISNESNGKDMARVGEHKDFEPGPVASISFGDRAYFQFVRGKKDLPKNIFYEQWLEDSSLLIFAGKLFKDELFHRVQRVENKRKENFELQLENFQTRRINFTFRYVPIEHIENFEDFPESAKEDIIPYIKKLAENSEYFKKLIH